MPRANSSDLPQTTLDLFNRTAKRVDHRSGAQQISKMIEDYIRANPEEVEAAPGHEGPEVVETGRPRKRK